MKQILNKYIIILIIFYIVWLLGIPFLFRKAIPVVCENVSHNSPYSIVVERPRLQLSILPTAKIYASRVEIKEKNGKDSTIISKPVVKIRLLPLISGHLHINRILADNVEIKSYPDKEIELSKDYFEKLSYSKVKCDRVKIDSFYAEIHRKNKPVPIIYKGKDVYFRKNYRFLILNAQTELDMNGKTSQAMVKLYLPQNNDVKKSDVNIKISNFDIAPIADYMKQYLPEDVKDISGIININVDKSNLMSVIENCRIEYKDSAKSLIFPDKLFIKSKFNITSKEIKFDNVNLDSDNIHAVISGSVRNYLDEALSRLNLNVQINKSRVEDFVLMLPAVNVEECNVYKLKKYKFFGDVIGNLTISGNIKEPDINGDVFVSNGVLIKPIKNAKPATIKLKFIGRYVYFDVTVPASPVEKVWVKGGVELYNVKYSDMRIWSTQAVDLAIAEEKVNPLHEILNFIIGPVPIMDVKGVGNIDITVKGNRKNPHVWGRLYLNNVTTYFNEIKNLVLTDAEATLDFNNQDAVFTLKRGKVNGQKFDIQGNCNLYGKFDFDVNSKNQDIAYLFNGIKTSTMIEEMKNMLPPFEYASGKTDLVLKVFGTIKDIEDIKYNKNLFTKGALNLLGNSFKLNGVEINNTKGVVNFDGVNADLDVKSKLGNSDLTAKAELKNDIVNLVLNMPRFNLSDLIPESKEFGNIILSVDAKYNGTVEPIEYDKINFKSQILGVENGGLLNLSNGEISLLNNKLNISNLKGNVKNSDSAFNINLKAHNINTKPMVSGTVGLNSFELSHINKFAQYSFVPKDIKDALNTIQFTKGKINLNSRINNNKINAYTDIGGFEFVYSPLELPVKVINGSLIVNDGKLRLNKINLLADNMPILLDGNVNNILSKQNFDVYFNMKPKQEFIDKYINKNQVYPIKIKGDIVCSAKIRGVKDNYDLHSEIKMAKDSSIYHLGATVGDIENAIRLILNTRVIKQNELKIEEFSYDKIISSQNRRTTLLNMLKASGGIEVYKDDLVFKDLKVKTQNPTDARIFNIIFRKPNIKQGQFTSNLRFNGKLSNPRLLGDFHIFETNIPFLDTTMKNITFVFKDKFIDISSKGEILGNDITLNATLKNKLTAPFYVEKANIDTKVLDLNQMMNKLKLSQLENLQTFESLENFDISTVVIKNLVTHANIIYLKNIVAENFDAQASLDERHQLDVKDFSFDIANGELFGNMYYNLANSNTGLKMSAKNIDANDISYILFDLKNQIYGDLTGDIKLACNGADFNNCMKTLSGNAEFNVSDGKMPKLGSLEYLLKAGNLLKGGITGLSINSVIDIITPLKTGDFSNIYGMIDIKDGVAHDIEISSRGKDLSLFITGNYNFATSIAELEVLGMLSKKISTMFGPVGNLSLNTLFNVIPGVDLSKDTKILERVNKIPGIELSNKAFRKFIAEIRGNINGDDYVASFKWIN